MITAHDVKRLVDAHPSDNPPRCVRRGAVVLVHSRWFMLEVPVSAVANEIVWPTGAAVPAVEKWRETYAKLPPGTGEAAQAMRVTIDDDTDATGSVLEPEPAIQLMSENHSAMVRVELYDFIRRGGETEFRLYGGAREAGKPHHVAVYRNGEMVGVVAQKVRRKEFREKGWDW